MGQIPNGEFVFSKISSVVFGVGAIQRLAEKVDEFGAKRALIVTVPELVADNGLANKIKEFDVADNERKQWKSRYESKCLETADKLNSWQLFKLLVQKLSWKK